MSLYFTNSGMNNMSFDTSFSVSSLNVRYNSIHDISKFYHNDNLKDCTDFNQRFRGESKYSGRFANQSDYKQYRIL